jgi:REP element-mobilizing transposase RayT
MSHSFSNIWVHSIWSTKDRIPSIQGKSEKLIYGFIKEEFFSEGCLVKSINGTPDHIHCLFLLNPLKSISQVVKQIKGSSSHFINSQNLISHKFSWQTGYAAYSVSESNLFAVERYIINQKIHHNEVTFEEEMDKINKFLLKK